jgi:glutathione S-transferase
MAQMARYRQSDTLPAITILPLFRVYYYRSNGARKHQSCRHCATPGHLTHPAGTPILRFVCAKPLPKAAIVHAPEVSLPILLTITLSHYCEKARWGLARAGIAYREERHAPGFHALAVRRAGGARSTPALVTSDGVIGDSTDILLWANERAATGRELYPGDPEARAEVLALEDRFDEELGPHARRAIYFHMLPSRRLTLPLMTYGVPSHERAPGLRPGIRSSAAARGRAAGGRRGAHSSGSGHAGGSILPPNVPRRAVMTGFRP